MPSPKLAERARNVVKRLARAYPDARLALAFETPLQLLVALILAAQARDDRVNAITPALFARFPTARDYADAAPAALEAQVRSINFYRQKTRALQACARALVERFGGEVPRDLDALTSLPHVGRKTANILRGNAFGIPAIGVDRHVLRLAQRLDLTREADADRAEAALDPLVRDADKVRFCYLLQAHGRAVCLARAPRCGECMLRDVCPSAEGHGAAAERDTPRRAAAERAKERPRRDQRGRRTSVPTKARKTSGTRTEPSRS